MYLLVVDVKPLGLKSALRQVYPFGMNSMTVVRWILYEELEIYDDLGQLIYSAVDFAVNRQSSSAE